MPTPRSESYYEVLTAAINDMIEHGYDSAERLAAWTEKLRAAALREMRPLRETEQMLREGLVSIYRRLVDQGEIARYHSGISRFTLAQVRPALRAELDRRILASAELIRLNRTEALEKTLRRFAGWSTSIPAGGARKVDRQKLKDDVRKPMKSLPFVERRVLIDQGHKLTAALNDVVARDAGAIAVIWHSHWRQSGYDYREDHKKRDGKIYLLRSSWARDQGLVRPGKDGYYDAITAVGEEPFCRCYAQYLYSLSRLPRDMLTKKGADALEQLRRAA